MEYEKKLTLAKEALESGSYDKNTIEYIFPELKESEDEKIRKVLIDYFKGYKEHEECGIRTFYGIPTNDFLTWLEKQGEQNLTDKVEPKFKVGDWVIFAENHNSVYQVERIDNYRYYLRYYLGGTLSVHFDNELIRLWTIQDAKDGDVLVTVDNKRPFIYKGCLDPNHPNSPVAYCGIHSEEYFCRGGDNFDHWWTEEKVQPATKEERDLLFQKIKEAGYKWNSEKKELNEIKQLTAFEEAVKDIWQRVKYPAAWSEEDEKMVKDIIAAIDTLYYHGMVNWLKSIKYRVKPQWKPSEEQLAALHDAAVYVDNSMFPYPKGILMKLYKQLKKL